MTALAKAHLLAQQTSTSAECFRDLLAALESGDEFPLSRLYELSYADFDLALKVLGEWRLQRYAYAAEKSAAAVPAQSDCPTIPA